MKNEKDLYLSGGIFFALLTEAAGRRPTPDEMRKGKKSNITEVNMLQDLIRFFNHSFEKPDGGTFKGNTSDYKCCKASFGTYLPFNDETKISAFDKRLKTDYNSLLKEMNDYIMSFLDSESEVRMRRLMNALFTIIEKDADIAENTLFYISEKPITKKELLSLDHYCLSNLLLALWHFIVMNRPDNKLGRATYETLYTHASETGARWKFDESFGRSYYRRFEFIVLAEPDLGIKKGPTEKTAEPEVIEVEEEEEKNSPRVEKYEAPYTDPFTGRQVMGQFHVEAKDHGIAVGILNGPIVIGKRGDKND